MNLDFLKQTPFTQTEDLIHVFIGGSELHGAKVQGTDDKDYYGLYIEKPDNIIGLFPQPHFVWSTADNDRRNGPDDVDITFYGLKKWAEMAAKGNPTALHFLFAPYESGTWEWWLPFLKQSIISKASAKQFRGFVDAQMGRLLGTRGRGKKGQRPELEQKFGYDVKAGMHAVRLLGECIELMSTGSITLPRPNRELLVDIRTGGWSLDRLSAYVNELFVDLNAAEAASKLPEQANRVALSRDISTMYRSHWGAVWGLQY
jgi:uncharacterized protein